MALIDSYTAHVLLELVRVPYTLGQEHDKLYRFGKATIRRRYLWAYQTFYIAVYRAVIAWSLPAAVAIPTATAPAATAVINGDGDSLVFEGVSVRRMGIERKGW